MRDRLLSVNQLWKIYDLIDQHNDDQEITVFQVTFHPKYIHKTRYQLKRNRALPIYQKLIAKTHSLCGNTVG